MNGSTARVLSFEAHDHNNQPEIKFEFQQLNLSILHVAKYQRELTLAECNRYKKEFDPNLVGVLLVSFRDGKWWIVDGQHRSVLLKMLGVKDYLCQIVRGLTYQEEAALFKKYNSKRRQLGRCDLLVADVEAGNLKSQALVRIVDQNGYSMPRMEIKGKVSIEAVASAEEAHTMLGDDGLDYTLSLTNATWPSNREAVQRSMLSGMARFVKMYQGEIDRKIFVKKLSKIKPDAILRDADTSVTYSVTNKDKPMAVARVIWKAYNDRLTEKNRLPGKFELA
jgi:hypothetical protein